ncbi:hypothetical protein L1987_60531 [Smallanthus sonchifolius]|uniref:Uncharacterized protein n=1 Tax=Smallanthus sonchifolius TaxID=185202 RepID=A0ACB9D8Q1_9ASTR|nr:hypothetical protein L1987_60531 [Smallanthus sonchifolius]
MGLVMGCVIGRLKSVEIVHTLIPLIARFNKDQVLQLDRNRQWSKALDGSDLPLPPLFKDVMEKNIIPQYITNRSTTLKATCC